MIRKTNNDLDVRPLYPLFSHDSKIILPGQTKRMLCSYNARCESGDEPPPCCAHGTCILLSHPEFVYSLILRPTVFTDGERLTLALTNASDHAYIIAKDSFDIASRLGHGIFRHAEVIPYERPIARSLVFPYTVGETQTGAS